MTAIAAIHDLSLAARYCHRLVLMLHGRVLAQGPPAQVLTPANIEAAFGVRAVVFQDPFTGSPSISLLDQARPVNQVSSGARVHVVCGGGTGARLMLELQRHPEYKKRTSCWPTTSRGGFFGSTKKGAPKK